MATKLDKPLRRQLSIRGKPFVVTLSPDGFKLVGKGRRKGLELSWEELTTGEAALASALAASLDPKLRLEPAEHRAKRNGHAGTRVARLRLVKAGKRPR
jgi:hypothetical protein